MDSPIQERREAYRFEMAVPVVLKTTDGDLLTTSRNISASGMLLQSPGSLSIGAKAQMVCSVPGQDIFYPDVCFHCEGTVIRLEPMQHGFGIAVACHGIAEYKCSGIPLEHCARTPDCWTQWP